METNWYLIVIVAKNVENSNYGDDDQTQEEKHICKTFQVTLALAILRKKKMFF